jgi:exosortase A-associated hydrolase 2
MGFVSSMSALTPFYLPGLAGDLFCVYYPSAESMPDRGDILYVPPFASEMLYSRNFISRMSRQFASLGFGVLSVDLYGSGDSAGDFGEARWEIWKEDLATGVRWLQELGRERITLWGLRMGCLLALDFAAQAQGNYESLFLWQPILSGQSGMDEFVQMHFAGDDRIERCGTLKQRQGLAAGEIVEIGGYALAAELIRAIDKLEIAPLGKLMKAPIHWMETTPKAEQQLDPNSLRVISHWTKSGIRVHVHKAIAGPFWLFPYCADGSVLTKHLLEVLAENRS